ncbi:KTSC domain-containing protein [Aminobacterium colombiense]|jgi:hypothetical protein|uniref:KTSC domain-containing protein n=1 Tax=Aminobacterium colombiense (strain DSM 12261 / ALA-1) TaxID=572547 RepID=D5EES6_AMICL|nr:KTSC domain-containing protein [Aminobacterium colombiense]ADE57058.1 conserved hypothetical protein [Aminobacterium colombiense DSM 12261]
MDRQNVNSSIIRSIGYDANNSTLEIEFNSGPVWQYFDFPESLWLEFEASESKGHFFRLKIKNQYSESRVG